MSLRQGRGVPCPCGSGGGSVKSDARVVVIGGGVVGVSVLYHLTKAGWKDVLLLERGELTSADEAARVFPIIDKRHFVGALLDPIEGHVDPYGVTHAYAKAAQIGGAQVLRHTRVIDLKARRDGSWDVITEGGNVHAEHVVNAGGLWAREVGRMVGLELPILAMQHQYLITEDLPALKGQKELLTCIDFEGEIYTRQERGGVLLGTYERAGVPWSPLQTPWEFTQSLLPEDLDRIAPSLEVGLQHFPALGEVGIRKVVNGPFTFAPDGNPLVGPVRGLTNFWVACGVMAGFSQGGGVGLALSQWMVEGDPGADVWAMDVARYGDWATLAYTNAKVRENYSRRFRIRFPNEELTAARPLRTTPVYGRLQAEHAVFGDYCGLEHALWFAPSAAEATEAITFHRSNAHPHVAAECHAVREAVGLLEISNYGKFEVTGPGTKEWLSYVMANRVPKVGRIALTPMLNERGKLIGDFTLCRLAAERVFLICTYAAQEYYRRWFERHAPPPGVTLRPCAMEYVGLSLAGPRSRSLLQGLTREDLSSAAFPFLSFRRLDVGMIPALVGRISFTGDLGYEIWVTTEYQRALYDLLKAAGAEQGLKLFGGRALNTLRIEKSFGTWAREYRPIYGPYEAGLGRFVDLKKGEFVGRAAALEERDSGGALRLVTFSVDASDADASGDEPVWHDGKVVGWVTSGAYGHSVRQSLALGYIPAALARETSGFEIEIIGERRKALRQPAAVFDPDGSRMRARPLRDRKSGV